MVKSICQAIKRIVNRRLIYCLKNKNYIDHREHDSDTKQTHRRRWMLNELATLDKAWISVCFDSARIFFMQKRERTKAVRSPATDHHLWHIRLCHHQCEKRRNLRKQAPPVKDAFEQWDCTQSDLQDSEQKLPSGSVPSRYDVEKNSEQGLELTSPIPIFGEACGIEAIQQRIRRCTESFCESHRFEFLPYRTHDRTNVSSIEYKKDRLHSDCYRRTGKRQFSCWCELRWHPVWVQSGFSNPFPWTKE